MIYFVLFAVFSNKKNYRDNGVKAIENLMKKKGKFDYILLETTGLADPGNLLSIFYLNRIQTNYGFCTLF